MESLMNQTSTQTSTGKNGSLDDKPLNIDEFMARFIAT